MSFFSALRRTLANAFDNRTELYGMNRRNLELIYPNNRRRDYVIADDKLLCKQILSDAGVPVAETLAVCDGLFAIPETLDLLAVEENFVIKPTNSSGGQGILVVGKLAKPGYWQRTDGSLLSAEQVQRHLASIIFGAYAKRALEDRAFIERRIVPHPVYQGFWNRGLCDVRVITLDAQPIIAMVRVPTMRSGGRANLHQGGIGLAVDLKSGMTVRARSLGRYITEHPESGSTLVGIQLPCWEQVLEVARATARLVPLKYLGVDLVMDHRRGPLVLEINARPGLEVQNVHGRGLGRSLEEHV